MTKPLEGIRVLELGQVSSLAKKNMQLPICLYCSLSQDHFVDRFSGKTHVWLYCILIYQPYSFYSYYGAGKDENVFEDSKQLLNFHNLDHQK